MTLTPSGRLLALVAAWTGLAVAAVLLPELRFAVLPALLALCAAVVADFVLVLREPPLVLERVPPDRLVVDAEAEVALVVSNPGGTACTAQLFDEVPRSLAPEDPVFRGVSLEPGASQRLVYGLCPRRRGDHRFGVAAALASSPLDLLRRRTLLETDAPVRVYPDTSRYLRRDVLDPRAILASLGVRPTRQRGEGTEFESLREYVRGDDPRRIDWRASARRGHLVSRLYQHERSHRVVVAVDTSRLMGALTGGGEIGDPSKLDHAIEAALALVYASLTGGDQTSLVAFDSALRASLGPKRQRSDLGHFVEALCPLDSRLVEADYRGLVRDLMVAHRKRSLVVVLTDFAGLDASQLVAPFALLARRHRVLVVALRDRVFDGLEGSSQSEGGLYRRIALDDLAREREEMLARLRRSGLETLDLVPEEVVAPVLNRFLALRYHAAA